jgi:hypothetical protein
MLLCYIDEAGNEQVLDPMKPDAPPVLVIAGLVVPETAVKDLAWGFLKLKQRYLPRQVGGQQLSALIATEIKGSNLRADIRSGSHRRTSWALGVLDRTMHLLEANRCALVSRVWVKREGRGLTPSAYYMSVAGIAEDFHHRLQACERPGMMILDARTKVKNTPNALGVTTRKFRSGGDPLPRLVESPVFGHSDSHLGLQVVDIIASALIFPLACLAYCDNMSWNTHCHVNYQRIQQRYAERLHRLECREVIADGSRVGGVRVHDLRGHRASIEIFGFTAPRQRPVPNTSSVGA